MNRKQFELLCSYALQGMSDDLVGYSSDQAAVGDMGAILTKLTDIGGGTDGVPLGVFNLLCQARDDVYKKINEIETLESYAKTVEDNELLGKEVADNLREAMGEKVSEALDEIYHIISTAQEEIEGYQTKLEEQQAATEKFNAMAAAHQALHDMAAAKSSGSEGEEIV